VAVAVVVVSAGLGATVVVEVGIVEVDTIAAEIVVEE